MREVEYEIERMRSGAIPASALSISRSNALYVLPSTPTARNGSLIAHTVLHAADGSTREKQARSRRRPQCAYPRHTGTDVISWGSSVAVALHSSGTARPTTRAP